MVKKKKTSPTKAAKPKFETLDVDSHKVIYREFNGREEVRIDGKCMPFFHIRSGYQLKANAYEPPRPTLLEAAAAYAKSIPACSPCSP